MNAERLANQVADAEALRSYEALPPLTVAQACAVVTLFRVGAAHGLDAYAFSKAHWGKSNRFASAFLNRLVATGWIERVNVFMASGYPHERYCVTEPARAAFSATLAITAIDALLPAAPEQEGGAR